MGFFGSLTGKDQRNDLRKGSKASDAFLVGGEKKARGELTTGFDRADSYLNSAQPLIEQGYGQAENLLAGSERKALEYLDPYVQDGRQASQMYGNALGFNGQEQQQQFAGNYAAFDPFRQQNADFATGDLQRSLNARGMSGGGYGAEAIARQSLQRGSQDYENYLNRISGVRDSGQQAATNAASLSGQYGGQRANMLADRTRMMTGLRSDQANLATGRGDALSNLSYGNAQQRANLKMGTANAYAQSRTAGVNNILGLGGMALKASGVGGYGQPRA